MVTLYVLDSVRRGKSRYFLSRFDAEYAKKPGEYLGRELKVPYDTAMLMI